MGQLFDKQLGDVREFVKRGVPSTELPYYVLYTCPAVRSEEFKTLCPIGKEMVALFESCEGQCTDPSDCLVTARGGTSQLAGPCSAPSILMAIRRKTDSITDS
jgi:hypothetical protein